MTQTKNIMPKHYQQLQSFERGAAYYREQRAAVFFKFLPKALKAKPRVFSVDTYVHYLKAHYPGFPCPSTATVYWYIEAGKLPELHNYDLPMKLRRRVKRPNHRHARLNKKRLESEPALMTLTGWKLSLNCLITGQRLAGKPSKIRLMITVQKTFGRSHLTTARNSLV
ncbi:hypothetical protein IMAU60204_01416 [Lactobacillus helveticus]|nr:Putative transposase [Lactobacillus helveticus H9]NRO08750.1 hypothetical protein [Lactobacillus helveticus]NRO47084.1 hypothetical protein [Lactobacillus helveticus]NRO56841.1 hypothetical protein [Lactobacillus helveticus]